MQKEGSKLIAETFTEKVGFIFDIYEHTFLGSILSLTNAAGILNKEDMEVANFISNKMKEKHEKTFIAWEKKIREIVKNVDEYFTIMDNEELDQDEKIEQTSHIKINMYTFEDFNEYKNDMVSVPICDLYIPLNIIKKRKKELEKNDYHPQFIIIDNFLVSIGYRNMSHFIYGINHMVKLEEQIGLDI